ncbi:centrosomal protein of 76 kDa-like [Branchiostoma floridae x Branchiostoma japonicum]
MALPPEKISELRQIIHNKLTQMDVHSRIRDAVSETMEESRVSERGGGAVGEEQVLESLRQRGIIDEILSEMSFEEEPSRDVRRPAKPATHFVDREDRIKTSTPAKKAAIDPTRRHLYLQVKGGKAFLEHLQEPEPLPGQVGPTFTLHVLFRGQRFRSKPVPCACDPDIQEGFLLELHSKGSGEAAQMADSTSLLSLCDPVHMVLIKTDVAGDTALLTSHYLEWRHVLSAQDGYTNTAVELMGVGTESKVPVGVLDIRLEILPHPVHTLAPDVITTQLNLEQSRRAERERLFLVYAKQWWREFLQIRGTNSSRLVKIFAQDENATNRPVCSFVRPLQAGRLLDTPRQAARFISLLTYEKASTVGGGPRAEQWCTMHAFLCRNKGDCEDHSVLLCSLLLGFGLDAYVCVGTKTNNTAHTWVLTLGMDGEATFWESLTGHRYSHQPINPDDPPAVEQPRPQYPYRSVGCVFNHQVFYANSQPTDAVEVCHFNFTDESGWKAMSEEAIKSVCGEGTLPLGPVFPPLCASLFDPGLLSADLELELRVLVTEHRKDLGLTTVWDNELSYLLTPALAAYEQERTTGQISGNEEFQQAIRRAVPDGHTFKGFPIQFLHRNARRAFAGCLRSPVCEEIVSCRGDHVRLAVRVRVFTYPEQACAVWIMFACKYRSIL